MGLVKVLRVLIAPDYSLHHHYVRIPISHVWIRSEQSERVTVRRMYLQRVQYTQRMQMNIEPL